MLSAVISLAFEAPPLLGERTTCGVSTMSNSVFDEFSLYWRNNMPSTGMSPSSGILRSTRSKRSLIKPPMTTV